MLPFIQLSECEELVGGYSQEMMGVNFCRCSVELVWCSRSHWSPSASIRWGENVTWSTHHY